MDTDMVIISIVKEALPSIIDDRFDDASYIGDLMRMNELMQNDADWIMLLMSEHELYMEFSTLLGKNLCHLWR